MAYRWEHVPESQIRAEFEAVLESKGESNTIRQNLHEDPEVQKWREQVLKLCQTVVDEKGIDNLNPDIVFNQIVEQARSSFPQSVTEKIKNSLGTFLQTKFEDSL